MLPCLNIKQLICMDKFVKTIGQSKEELSKIKREKRLIEMATISNEFPWISKSDTKKIARIYRLRHLVYKHQNNIRRTLNDKDRELHTLRLTTCKADLKQLCTPDKELPDTRDDIDKLMYDFGYQR